MKLLAELTSLNEKNLAESAAHSYDELFTAFEEIFDDEDIDDEVIRMKGLDLVNGEISIDVETHREELDLTFTVSVHGNTATVASEKANNREVKLSGSPKSAAEDIMGVISGMAAGIVETYEDEEDDDEEDL